LIKLCPSGAQTCILPSNLALHRGSPDTPCLREVDLTLTAFTTSQSDLPHWGRGRAVLGQAKILEQLSRSLVKCHQNLTISSGHHNYTYSCQIASIPDQQFL